MRKWKRVETAEGTRFRSALAAHEATLLQSLVKSLMDMLVDREASSPTDELEELTGMRTGHSDLRRTTRWRDCCPISSGPSTTIRPARAAESLNSALRSLHEPEIIDAKRHAGQRLLDTLPAGAAGSRSPRTTRTAGPRASTTFAWRWARCSRSGPTGPIIYRAEHPMAGHLDVYQWLTVLQEYLVLGLMGKR